MTGTLDLDGPRVEIRWQCCECDGVHTSRVRESQARLFWEQCPTFPWRGWLRIEEGEGK